MESSNGSTATSRANERVEDLSASQVAVERSAVRSLHADHASIDRSFVGNARFDYGTVRQSSAAVVVGRSVACDEVHTAVLISPVVRGDVHTWLDLRTAVAIGFGMALGSAFLKLTKLLARRLLG